MMRCGLLLLIGCSSEPSLAVTVQHPAKFAVTQTVVTVYAGDDIRCSEIEQGDRSEAELSAITVDEVDVTRGGRIEVSRLGGKSIVARGFDAERRFVTAGCRDLGEIAGATVVEIATRPTAMVAIDPAQPDRPFAERAILVTMSDVTGAPLDGMVSWLLTGPAGAAPQPPAAGVAARDGDARIQVADLGTPGPQGLRIRVPWATQPLPLVTGFDLSHATEVALGGGNLASHPSCDLRGRAGQPPSLVCLTQANAQLHRDVVEITWQTDRYVATVIGLPLDNQFALFVDRDGSASEPIYVLSATAVGAGTWYRVGAPGSGTVVEFGGPLVNVVYLPACKGGAASALVGVQAGLAAPVRQFFTPAGSSVIGPQTGELFSGGCVADVDNREHQAAVVSNGGNEAALVRIAGTRLEAIAGTRLTGSGFIASQTQGVVEARFAGTRLQATGTVVFEAVVAPVGNSFKLVERREVEAAAPPTRIIAGQLDRDGDTDLMWDMAAGLRRRVFQVSLAKQVAGGPLTAMTSGPPTNTAGNPADFLVGDLDGQGTDEMVLFTHSTVTIYSPD